MTDNFCRKKSKYFDTACSSLARFQSFIQTTLRKANIYYRGIVFHMLLYSHHHSLKFSCYFIRSPHFLLQYITWSDKFGSLGIFENFHKYLAGWLFKKIYFYVFKCIGLKSPLNWICTILRRYSCLLLRFSSPKLFFKVFSNYCVFYSESMKYIWLYEIIQNPSLPFSAPNRIFFQSFPSMLLQKQSAAEKSRKSH